MSLIEELREKSNIANDIKKQVIEEIKAYFDEYLKGNELENDLKTTILKEEIRERKSYLTVAFWEYYSRCSETYFRCGKKCWYIPKTEDSDYFYKGVELSKIQRDVCSYVALQLELKLKELGFTIIDRKMVETRLHNYEKKIYFGW